MLRGLSALSVCVYVMMLQKGVSCTMHLKICEKNRHFTDESGLGIHYEEVRPLWQEFERRVLALATASYDFAFLRADGISHSLLHSLQDD